MGFSEDRAHGRFGTFYLLIADNPFVLWDATEAWKSAWRDSTGQSIPISTFSGPHMDFHELRSQSANISLFEDIRPILIKGADKVHRDRQDELIEIVRNATSATRWLLTAESVDKRTVFYKSLSGLGPVEQFPKIYPEHVSGWVQRISSEFGVSLAPAAVERLAVSFGTELFGIRQAIERGILFMGQKRRIELADIETVLAGDGEHDVYQLLEFAARADFGSALRIGRSLWAEGDKSPLWYTALHLQCVQYARIIELWDRSNDEIGRAIGMHPFRVGKLRESAKAFGTSRLSECIEAIFATDWDVKTSAVTPAMAWEILIWRMCLPQNSQRQTLLDPFRRRQAE